MPRQSFVLVLVGEHSGFLEVELHGCYLVKYESKKLKSSIRVALAAAVTALPKTAFEAESGEIATYDLDTVEVDGQRPVSQPVETEE